MHFSLSLFVRFTISVLVLRGAQGAPGHTRLGHAVALEVQCCACELHKGALNDARVTELSKR